MGVKPIQLKRKSHRFNQTEIRVVRWMCSVIAKEIRFMVEIKE